MTLEEISIKIDNGDDIAVHCDTQEKAIKLLTMCKEKGYKWYGGGVELIGVVDGYNGHWHRYQENTVYFIEDYKGNYITYGDVEYCKEKGILFVDYETEEFPLIKSDYDISFLLD